MGLKRNRYYPGKLLKSEDLTNEQLYTRTCIQHNQLLRYGSGLVTGLNVMKRKGSQFLLKKGCAIDHLGNTIYVEKDELFDIRELNGFHQLQENEGIITIKYQEKEVIQDLTDKEADFYEDSYTLSIYYQDDRINYSPDYFVSTIIFQTDDITILQHLPCMLPTSGSVQLILEVQKNADVKGSIHYHIQCNKCAVENDIVQADFTFDKQQESFYFPLCINAQAGGKKAVFIIKDVNLSINESHIDVSEFAPISIKMVEDLHNSLKALLYQKEVKQKDVQLGYVRFHMIKDELIIDQLQSVVNQFSVRPIIDEQQRFILSQYAYTKDKQDIEHVQIKEYASGSISCHFDDDQTLFVSETIKHGLGGGNVFIQAGLKSDHMDVSFDQKSELYFGDARLFQEDATALKIAIRAHMDTGTFQIGIKRLEECRETTMKLHWYAKLYAHDEIVEESYHLLYLQPTTIVLEAFQTCTFTPIFDQMEYIEDVIYEVCSEDGGSIDEEGNYLAPATAGIYQIKAKTKKQSVYAYVSVKGSKDG